MTAIRLSLALGLASFMIPAAAPAQAPAAGAQQLTDAERQALRPLGDAYRQRNWPAVAAALPAAAAAAQSPFGRYVVGQIRYELGLYTRNAEAQAAGIEAMLTSGAAPPETTRALLTNQVALALRGGTPERAEPLMTRIVEANPADPIALAQLAEIKLRLASDPRRGGNQQQRTARSREALALWERALQAAGASGTLPESFYRRAMAVTFDASSPSAVSAGQMLVTRFPTPVNWRDALLQYRDLHPNNPELALDVGRLMRRAGALAGEVDHLELARALLTAGRGMEASALLSRAVESGMVSSSEPAARDLIAQAGRAAASERSGLAARRTQARSAATGALARQVGDTLFGQEQWAEAAEFYRLALEKGGEDAGLLNTRLGAALALAGQRPEGEAILRTVTGPYAGLAGYWLIHLAQRPA